MFQADLLAGKKVLVTGGGSGLGKSMGRRFLELGADLVICGRREHVLAETTAEFHTDYLGRASYHVCDIRDADALDAMIEAIWRERPLDVLVNNAAGNFLAKSETLSPRAVDAVVRIVLNGTANATLAGSPRGGPASNGARCCRSSPATPGPARPTCCPRPWPRPGCSP